MEQQQFRVSFSVGTKLLISIVVLLVIMITFLNISTIFILREDKRAYIYQSQAKEAVLLGKEFVNLSRHAIDTLRLSLGSVDPLRPITPPQTIALQSVINNQSDVLSVSIQLLNLNTRILAPITAAYREKALGDYRLTLQDLAVPEEGIKVILPVLGKNPYAFVNLSKMGEISLLGVVVADEKLKSNPSGMPIAIGVLPLKDFGSELKGTNLTIATRAGWVLFDTDSTVLFSKKNINSDPLFESALNSQVATGAYEFSTQGNHYLGSYVHPGLDLIVLNRTEWQKAMKATYSLTEKFILLGLMAIGAAVVFAILFSKTLTAPLQRLYQGTKEIARGNFNLELVATGRDEIGALTSSFNVMSKKINLLIQESMQKVHLENELKIASTVQQTLIPSPNFQDERIKIHSHYQAASQCGGDWWGFFRVNNKMCVMIADATGHGLPSALITASARSCFSVMYKLAEEDPEFSFSPSAMLSYANRVIYDASLGKIMMTFFIGVINFDEGSLIYANAGHNPPWLFKKEGATYALKSLTAVGHRLGEAQNASNFEEKFTTISPNDILFLYTDGLLEGKSRSGEMYGKKRTRNTVESSLAGGPEKIVTALIRDFLKHNEGKELDDDVTLAAAVILGSQSNHSSYAQDRT